MYINRIWDRYKLTFKLERAEQEIQPIKFNVVIQYDITSLLIYGVTDCLKNKRFE